MNKETFYQRVKAFRAITSDCFVYFHRIFFNQIKKIFHLNRDQCQSLHSFDNLLEILIIPVLRHLKLGF